MYIIVFKTAFSSTFPFHFSSPHYACPEVIRVRDFFPKRHFFKARLSGDGLSKDGSNLFCSEIN